ncbi:unnamed protein product [Cochlearia groenlandica]
MSVSIWQVSRFRIHGWLKNNSIIPNLLYVRASSVNCSRTRWLRRSVTTTTQGGSETTTKSSVLRRGGAVVPVKTIVDAEIKDKTQPFGNLQQRLAQKKDLSKLLTFIVFDLETSGGSRDDDRIVEIAAQDIGGGEDSTFQSLVNPNATITNYNQHGISNYMVRRPEVPRTEELIPIFLKYVQSRRKPGGYLMFVAHNGHSFDFRFLINEFSRYSYEVPHDWLLLDSLPLARETMKSLEPTVKLSSKLAALGEYYNLARDGQAHRAMSDVLLLSQVFQKLIFDLKLSLSDLVLRSHSVSDIVAAMADTKARNNKKAENMLEH